MLILTIPSFASIKTVSYTSMIPEHMVGADKVHTFPYFDPALGTLVSVNFIASLNGTLDAQAENLGSTGYTQCYVTDLAEMYLTMINGDDFYLNVALRVPKTGYASVGPFDGAQDLMGSDTFSGQDYGDTSDIVIYTAPDDVDDYYGVGTFNLPMYTIAASSVRGGGNWYTEIATTAWSHAIITYTYDEKVTYCLSGYKINGCTGEPISGWTVIVNNSTNSWSAITDQTGFWKVCGLKTGTYTVREALQSGWIQTSLPLSYTETIEGVDLAKINFTNQKLYCISGYKIDSSTGKGLLDWNIALENATGTITAKTGPDGKYEFCNLAPGSYRLTEEMLPGYIVVQKVSNPVILSCENIANKNFTNKPVDSLCGECWPSGRPTYLVMTYTGETCTANCNSQAAGKVIVTGDPAGASPVRIVVRDSSSTGTVWFDGTVALGGTFVIDPPGTATFGTNTWVQISESAGNVLQTIIFHTSCSQPLVPGDMYGSLLLGGCIGAENLCPTAADDTYNALNNTPLVVSGPGVLGNDADPEGDKISIVSYTQPGNGIVNLNPDGSFTYTPNTDFCGTDRFSYKITDSMCDKGYQDEADVTINVRCVLCKVSGGEALTFSGKQVSWTITNSGPDPLDISSIYLVWPTANGKETSVRLNGVEIYSPDLPAPSATISSGWKGTVAARTIAPGQTSTLALVFERTASTIQSVYTINVQFSSGCSINFVPVNKCPSAAADSYNVLKNTQLTVSAPGVLSNDADPEGSPITVASSTQPSHGTVVLNSDGSFTYTPSADYCGPDSFTYKVTDGACDAAGQNQASVSINVRCASCEGANALTFSGKQVSWQITNYAATPISISSIYLIWPAANKKEMKVKLDGVEIYSPDLAPPSATISSGWKGTIDARSIGPGETSTLTFEFETTASTNQNAYTIQVQLDPGCSLNFVPSP